MARNRLGRRTVFSVAAYGGLPGCGAASGRKRCGLLLLLHQRRVGATARASPVERRRSAVRQEMPRNFSSSRKIAARGRRTCAIRFAVPESGSTFFDDAVFGRVEFSNSEIED